MLKRIITAVVALIVILPVIFFGGEWGTAALAAVICGISVYEMLGCLGLLKKWAVSIPSVLISTFFVILVKLLSYDLSLFAYISVFTVPALLVYVMTIAVIGHKSLDVERMLMFFSFDLYISAGLVTLVMLRIHEGMWAFWYVLLIAWLTDIFAYFTGMLFGKRKLCPEISPKKTIAGAVGGTVFGTLAGMALIWFVKGDWLLGLISLPLSVISQFGDLSASVIKRRFGIKDYGKIFPGHGGVLDRLDSITPVSLLTAVTLFFIEKF